LDDGGNPRLHAGVFVIVFSAVGENVGGNHLFYFLPAGMKIVPKRSVQRFCRKINSVEIVWVIIKEIANKILMELE